MLTEILLAIVQAATEFLPISSSGHLALFSNLFSEVDLFFFVMLHLASLFAVITYTRREIYKLVTFDKRYKKMWLYLLLGIIPAGLAGLFLKDYFESLASNYFFLAGAFFFTGIIVLSTKNLKKKRGLHDTHYTAHVNTSAEPTLNSRTQSSPNVSEAKAINSSLNFSRSLIMGLCQVLALFPGVSRSGMTISSGLFLGVDKKEAFRFSFLMLIPLTLGAVVLSWGGAFFSWSLVAAFIVGFFMSLFFLRLLEFILVEDYFWAFGIYCIAAAAVSLGIGLIN